MECQLRFWSLLTLLVGIGDIIITPIGSKYIPLIYHSYSPCLLKETSKLHWTIAAFVSRLLGEFCCLATWEVGAQLAFEVAEKRRSAMRRFGLDGNRWEWSVDGYGWEVVWKSNNLVMVVGDGCWWWLLVMVVGGLEVVGDGLIFCLMFIIISLKHIAVWRRCWFILDEQMFQMGGLKPPTRITVDERNPYTTWDVLSLVNNGINYQPQLVFSPDFFHQQHAWDFFWDFFW